MSFERNPAERKSEWRTCPRCDGTGKNGSENCDKCKGAGRVKG